LIRAWAAIPGVDSSIITLQGKFMRYSRILAIALTGLLYAVLTARIVSAADTLLRLQLDETSGSTASDESEHATHGTFINGVTLGAVGATGPGTDFAARFDGNNDHVAVADASHLDWSSGELTVMAWVKPNGYSNFAGVVVKGGDSLGSPEDANYSLMIMNNMQVRFAAGDEYDGTTQVTAGSWHHLAVTYDGSTLKMYVDGQLDVQHAAAITPSVNDDALCVGVNKAGNDVYFAGLIDDVRIHDRALSAEELAALYLAASQYLVAHWSFDDGAGAAVVDVIGENHGAILGAGDWMARCNGDGYLKLTGAGTYVEVVAREELDFEGDATISGWFKLNSDFDASSEASQVICEKFKTNHYNMHVALAGADYGESDVPEGALVCKINTGNTSVRYVWSARTEWSEDVWYHFAFTINSGSPENSELYVNGLNGTGGTSGSGTDTHLGYSADFHIGGRNAEDISGYRYLDGAVDDFRLYNYRLTSSKIVELYGLLLHWRLDETSGSTANDFSGLGLHGTSSGVAFAGGNIDGAYQFNGSNSKIENSTSVGALTGLSEITVMLWVNSDVTNQDRGIFHTNYPGGQDDRLALRYDKDGWAGGGHQLIKASISTTSGATAIESSSNKQTSEWQHIALVWKSGGHLQLYLDGQLDTPSDDSGPVGGTINNVDRLVLGLGMKNQKWLGLMDDFRIYNRAMCGEEIHRHAGGSAPNGLRIIKWVGVK
jgi:hypothetical protein